MCLCYQIHFQVNGGVVICVGVAGCGRRAAAIIGAISVSATVSFVYHPSQFNTQIKNVRL